MDTEASVSPQSDDFDCDFLVIGSGFGGSVAALRLAEKGWSVRVVERGRRWLPEDFPKTNWNVFESIWAPIVGCTGILRLSLLSDVLVLSGSGVGGGSLVYANTLLVPPEPFFRAPQWAEMADWQTELAPYYAKAKRMLGAVPNPVFGAADRVLLDVATDMGVAHTFKATDVGVFFGEPDVEVADPYFDGAGPRRVGCIQCGGCMTGCRHRAKNTLDHNYLYLAERLGVEIVAERKATRIRAIGGAERRGADGWLVDLRRATGLLGGALAKTTTVRARNVVCAAGVLGTLELLLGGRDRGDLPSLPPSLGQKLRTNSEAILGASARSNDVDYSAGVAITSGAFFDDHTHVEVVRYAEGNDVLALLATVMVDGGGRIPRAVRWLGVIIRHPIDFVRSLWPFGWARRSIILLVMQTLDNSLRAVWSRSWLRPWRKVLKTRTPPEGGSPTYIPIANEVARRVAAKMGGEPMASLNEVLLDIPVTAHVLGGCAIGADATTGVLDADHRVYGHEGLYVCDGSMIPANLGVNPSLTITAMSERAMARMPAREPARAAAAEPAGD